jgi:xanthine dehydrogenase/oxidase
MLFAILSLLDCPFVTLFSQVTAQGQIICGVLAKTREASRVAARKVKIEYEDLGAEAILTIKESVQKKRFYAHEEVSNGDVEEVFRTAAHVVQGEVRVGGQEHFYLETQGVLAIPKNEHGEMEIFATTQVTLFFVMYTP